MTSWRWTTRWISTRQSKHDQLAAILPTATLCSGSNDLRISRLGHKSPQAGDPPRPCSSSDSHPDTHPKSANQLHPARNRDIDAYDYFPVLSHTFERLFKRLVVAFKRHQVVARTTDSIAELGAARWDLELARASIAKERVRLVDQVVSRSVVPRQTAVSDDDLARLRVFGVGCVGGNPTSTEDHFRLWRGCST